MSGTTSSSGTTSRQGGSSRGGLEPAEPEANDVTVDRSGRLVAHAGLALGLVARREQDVDDRLDRLLAVRRTAARG